MNDIRYTTNRILCKIAPGYVKFMARLDNNTPGSTAHPKNEGSVSLQSISPAKTSDGGLRSLFRHNSHRQGPLVPNHAFARLFSLPPELQFMILSFLDFGDIEQFRRSCHFVRSKISKPVIRALFPDLKSALLATCYVCLYHDATGGHIVAAQRCDARFPLASKCITCTARTNGFIVGHTCFLANGARASVCRWCGYPVESKTTHCPPFHDRCRRMYDWASLLHSLAGSLQWIMVIVASALCWRYFKYDKRVWVPATVSASIMYHLTCPPAN